MSKFNLFDYIFVLRPLILIPCWNFLLIGAYLARGRAGFSADIWIGLALYTALMGGVYILNQITDIKTDRINKKLFFLSEKYISTRAAYTEMVLLCAFAIVLSLMYGAEFVAFILISLVLGIVYSLPPVKLKGKPILDTLSNTIGYGMINFAVGWLLVRSFEWSMFFSFLPYALSICAVFMNTTVADIEGDRKAGEMTTAVFFGTRITAAASTIVLTAAVVIAYMLRDWICFIPAVLALPLFAIVAIYNYRKNKVPRRLTITSFRLPGFAFTVMTCILYPLYAVIVLVIIIGMRLYYKQRFGLSYPTLSQG